jgi:microcystin-dependent protein
MALNFPNSPIVGQEYENFVWNGSAWVPAQTLPGGLPAGSIISWGGSVAPANWLLCDGSVVSRTTYASLFAAVGTAYGAGNGSTTFQLPDLRGRIPVGRNGGSFGSLGATGGSETHVLTIGELPSHTHSFSATTSSDGAHTHTLNGSVQISQNGFGQNSPINGNAGNFTAGTANSAGAHTHTISGTSGATGSGQAHNNVQPYQVVNYIIKATAASTPGDSELATRTQPVVLGGTGATSLTSGGYLKGNGTDAIVSQSGIPATDLTGTINSARLPNIPIDIGGTGATTGSGLVPIIPSSVVVNAGSASVSANGVITFANATTISVNNCFTSAFSNYRILFDNNSATNYSDGSLQLRSGGTNLTTTTYFRNGVLSDTAAVAGFSSNNVNGFLNTLATHPSGVSHAHAIIEIRRPFEAKPTTMMASHQVWTGSIQRFLTMGGFNTNATAYDGFSVTIGAGTFGGTFQIYGYR